MAAVSKTLVELVGANLKGVAAPEGYDAFREKLKGYKPDRAPPIVKEASENTRRIDSADKGE